MRIMKFLDQAVRNAEVATQVLFEHSVSSLSSQDVVRALEHDRRLHSCTRNEVLEQPIWKLAGKYGLVGSKSKFIARRSMATGD